MGAREVLARELYAWALGIDRPPADMSQPSESFFESADRFLDGLQEAGLLVMPADDIAESERLQGRMAGLLDRTATALKGEPGPLTMHSWHDLPEKASDAMGLLVAKE